MDSSAVSKMTFIDWMRAVQRGWHDNDSTAAAAAAVAASVTAGANQLLRPADASAWASPCPWPGCTAARRREARAKPLGATGHRRRLRFVRRPAIDSPCSSTTLDNITGRQEPALDQDLYPASQAANCVVGFCFCRLRTTGLDEGLGWGQCVKLQALKMGPARQVAEPACAPGLAAYFRSGGGGSGFWSGELSLRMVKSTPTIGQPLRPPAQRRGPRPQFLCSRLSTAPPDDSVGSAPFRRPRIRSTVRPSTARPPPAVQEASALPQNFRHVQHAGVDTLADNAGQNRPVRLAVGPGAAPAVWQVWTPTLQAKMATSGGGASQKPAPEKAAPSRAQPPPPVPSVPPLLPSKISTSAAVSASARASASPAHPTAPPRPHHAPPPPAPPTASSAAEAAGSAGPNCKPRRPSFPAPTRWLPILEKYLIGVYQGSRTVLCAGCRRTDYSSDDDDCVKF
uniref:CRIB domain-containing protein n=1 Tax=Macrostomum lignano TaxID=282301 RepID=A0A1I8F7P6_9PLAT